MNRSLASTTPRAALLRGVILCSVATGALLVAGLPGAGHAQAPAPTLVVDGTVLEVQPGVTMCGVVAVASWVRIRVDAVHTPIGGHLPPELYVLVQCNRLGRGQRRRFRLVGRRPTRGSWRGFPVTPPDPPAPPWWALRISRISPP